MTPLLYEVLIYFTEAVISAIFIATMLPSQNNKVLQVLVWCELSVLIVIMTPDIALVKILLVAILEIILTWFFYIGKASLKLSLFFVKEALLLASSSLSFLLCKCFVDKNTLLFDRGHCDFLHLVIFSLVTSIAFQFTRKKMGVEEKWILVTQSVLGTGELCAFTQLLRSNTLVTGESVVAEILILACFVSANISIGMLAPYLLRRINWSNSITLGKQLSSMEFKYYKKSVENDKLLTELRHDIANHIQTIYSLINNGEREKGLEILKELQTSYAHADKQVWCKNPVVNIILFNKKAEAEEKNIEVQIKIGNLPEKFPLSDFDISTVILNLFDNAIRGCVESEQSHPRLIVEMLKKNDYLVIRVLNSCRVEMHIESTDKLESTKDEKTTHGIGMPIISGIAKKHRGDFMVSAQNGIFTATVVMPMK